MERGILIITHYALVISPFSWANFNRYSLAITSRNADKVARFHRNYELVRQKMVELEERDRIRNFQPPVRGEDIMQM